MCEFRKLIFPKRSHSEKYFNMIYNIYFLIKNISFTYNLKHVFFSLVCNIDFFLKDHTHTWFENVFKKKKRKKIEAFFVQSDDFASL